MSFLDAIIENVRTHAKKGHRPVVVFDLDSTLFSTQERNFAILREFASVADAPHALVSIVGRLCVGDMGWNIMDDLRVRGLSDDGLLRRLRSFWRERFFTNEYLRHDKPIPGAVEFVADVHVAGAIVFYLTGRDEPGMGAGTRESLRTHAFPFEGERVVLELKPRFEDDDLSFKRSAIDRIRQLGEVVAACENEPANANLFCDAFPKADVLFLETVHSPNPPPLCTKVARLGDFRR
ncbi:MAG: HAD family hydrolase [Deltaproteobacteria bacterium]|nr:HAD family hydrolase [Deltaproteobacteria bacterium]